jgi:uncharacterized membrane protein SirB2
MVYLAVKYLHVSCVILSGCGFVFRGVLLWRDSPWLGSPWARRLPDTVDSLLLASAITLALMLEQYPFVHGWLTAKVLGLLLYIGLGIRALRPGASKGVRMASWLAALGVLGYIVSVALTKHPAGFLAFF